MAASRERPAAGADPRPDCQGCRGRRDRDRRHRRLCAGRRSGRVSRGRGVGIVGRCPDLHALTATLSSSRRRRSSTAQRSWSAPGDHRRAHALLPHQLGVGSSHRPGPGVGGALPVGGRERDHRGVPVRVGFHRDRCRVPRSRAHPRTIPGPECDHLPPNRRTRRRRSVPAANSARPTREEWSSRSSSPKPTRTISRVLRRSLTFPDAIVASDAMPPLWTGNAWPNVAEWPLPPEVVTHPRTAGSFARALSPLAR